MVSPYPLHGCGGVTVSLQEEPLVSPFVRKTTGRGKKSYNMMCQSTARVSGDAIPKTTCITTTTIVGFRLIVYCLIAFCYRSATTLTLTAWRWRRRQEIEPACATHNGFVGSSWPFFPLQKAFHTKSKYFVPENAGENSKGVTIEHGRTSNTTFGSPRTKTKYKSCL